MPAASVSSSPCSWSQGALSFAPSRPQDPTADALSRPRPWPLSTSGSLADLTRTRLSTLLDGDLDFRLSLTRS